MTSASADPARLVRADLGGKTALVTGAASGIGAASARALAAGGAAVALVDRDERGLEEVAADLRDRGARAAVLVGDLADRTVPARVVADAVAELGALDVLVHSAGIYAQHAFATFPLDVLDRVMATNFYAPYLITQAALPHLGAGASVVFIASATATLGQWGQTAYAPAKGAIVTLVRVLTAELAPRGIRVNAISPGMVAATGMTRDLLADPAVRTGVDAAIPAKRCGEPEDIAGVVAFLASDAAAYVHGTNVAVDGGVTVASPVSLEE